MDERNINKILLLEYACYNPEYLIEMRNEIGQTLFLTVSESCETWELLYENKTIYERFFFKPKIIILIQQIEQKGGWSFQNSGKFN